MFTFGVWLNEPGPHDSHADHEACPAQPVDDKGYQDGHDASAVVFIETVERQDSEGRQVVWPTEEFDCHPLWPAICKSCGAAVTDDWVRQVNQSRYLAAGDGRKWCDREIPAGAMWDAVWLHGTDWCGADGVSLQVMLPPGGPSDEWCADCPSTGGKPWERVGDPRDPPSLSVTPSILTPRYHGYLTAGFLVEC